MLTNLFVILLIFAAWCTPWSANADVALLRPNNSTGDQPSSSFGAPFSEIAASPNLTGSGLAVPSHDRVGIQSASQPTYCEKRMVMIAQSNAQSNNLAVEQEREAAKPSADSISETGSRAPVQSAEAQSSENADAVKGTSRENQKGKSKSSKSGKEEESIRLFSARLKGSMCAACLMQLEEKFQRMHGVLKARIARSETTSEERYAEIEILYVQPKLNQQKIRKLIERNDFGVTQQRDSSAG